MFGNLLREHKLAEIDLMFKDVHLQLWVEFISSLGKTESTEGGLMGLFMGCDENDRNI